MSDDKQPSTKETPEVGTSKSEGEATPVDGKPDVKATAGDSPEGTAQPQDEKPMSDNDVNSLKEKVSSLERERNELYLETKRLGEKESTPRKFVGISNDDLSEYGVSTTDELNSKFFGNRTDYESYRTRKIAQGQGDPGSFESTYSGYRPGGTRQTNNQQQTQPTQAPVDPRAIASTVRTEMEFEAGFKSFVKKVPALDFTKIENPVERDATYERVMKLSRLAAPFVMDHGMSTEEALVTAYNALPENREKQIDRAREDGKLVGRHEAFAKGSGVSTGMAGGSARETGDKTQLTDSEKAMAKATGIKEEDLLETKRADIEKQQQGLGSATKYG